jgi:hypothetical protein
MLADIDAAGWEAMSSGSWGRPYQASISFFAAGSLAWLRRRHRFRLVGIALQRHDSPLEESGFEPSVPLGEKRSFRNASIRELHRAAYQGGPQTISARTSVRQPAIRS